MRFIQRLLLLCIPVLLLGSSTLEADEAEYPRVGEVILSSDLIVVAQLQRYTHQSFWVSIVDVHKGRRYGLKAGSWLKLKNIHHGACMESFNIAEYPKALYFLKHSQEGWLVQYPTMLITRIEEEKLSLFMEGNELKLQAKNLGQELLSFHQAFRLGKPNSIEAADSSRLQLLAKSSKLVWAQLNPAWLREREILKSQAKAISKPDTQILYIVETQARYIGSLKELMDSLPRSLPGYQAIVKEQQFEGKVFLRFVVEKDSSLSSIKVARGFHPTLDKELLEAFPKCCWVPAQQRGKPTRSYVTLPFRFVLHE